jgi:hypothetical protein
MREEKENRWFKELVEVPFQDEEIGVHDEVYTCGFGYFSSLRQPSLY